MPLQGLIAFKLVALLPGPQLYRHVFRARHHIVSIRMKVDVIDHASVFPEGLLALASLIVPDLNACIFT